LAFLAIPIMVTAGTPGGASLRRPAGEPHTRSEERQGSQGTEEEESRLGV
jgi:hypothetical protein